MPAGFGHRSSSLTSVDNGGFLGALPGPSSLDTLGTAALYAVVLGFVFIECALLVGFLLPGDTLLVAAGVAAHSSHKVSLGWLMAGVFVAAVAGEVVGYVIGARAGLALLQKRNGRVVNRRNIARAEEFSARYGVFAVIAARWIPWLRTFAPLLAGATRMPWPRFMVANVVGALCWGPLLILIGYLAASVPALRHVSLALAVVAVVVALVAGLLRYWRATRRPNRADHVDQIDQVDRDDQEASDREPATHRRASHAPPEGDRQTAHTTHSGSTDGTGNTDSEGRTDSTPGGPIENVGGQPGSEDRPGHGDRHSLDSRER